MDQRLKHTACSYLESVHKSYNILGGSRCIEPGIYHKRRAKSGAARGLQSSSKDRMLGSLLETRAQRTPRCECRRSWADALAALGAGSSGGPSTGQPH